MRIIRFLLLVLLGLISIPLIVLHSQWGNDFITQKFLNALKESGYQIEIEKMQGAILQGFDCKGVRIESKDLSLSIDELQFHLSLLALLQKEIFLTKLEADGVSWKTHPQHTFGTSKRQKWAVHISHFHLTNVHLPENIDANFEGSIKLGSSSGNFFVQGALQSSTLKVIPISLPIDASINLEFFMKGSLDHLTGRLSGTILPETDISYLERPWQIYSRLTFDKKMGWTLSSFKGASDHILCTGEAVLTPKGDFQHATIQVQKEHILAKCTLRQTPEGIAIAADTKISQWQYHQILLEQIETHSESLWANQTLQGNGNGTFTISGKPYEANGAFSWEPQASFFLTQAELKGPSCNVSGDLEIRPDLLLIGQTDIQIDNLADLPFGLYGKIQGKVDWFQSIGKQVITVDAHASDFYWKDLFADAMQIDVSLIDPFENPKGRLVFEGADFKWHELFLHGFRFETLIGTEIEWPFALSILGRWKHPVELDLSGSWTLQNGDFTASILSIDGTFYNHPVSLQTTANVEYSKNAFFIHGLNCAFSNAHLSFTVDGTKSDFASTLSLEHLPLDIFSLNPLDVKIDGTLDCNASLQEKNGQSKGEFQAQIHQMRVGNEEPLTTSGTWEGRLSKNRLDISGSLFTPNHPFLTCNTSLPLEIHLMPPSASFPLDQKAQGYLTFQGRIEELLDFFNLGTHRLEGDLTADFSLDGTLQSPSVTGNMRFEQGYYENYLTGTRLFNITATGYADQDLLHLESIEAIGNTGSVIGSGVVRCLPSQLFPFTFDFSLNQFQATQIDLVNIETEGKIHIEGDLKEATAKGHLDVIKSDLHIPTQIPRSFPDLVVTYKNATKPIEPAAPLAKEPYPLHLDLEVKAPQGIFIDGRGLNSEWTGDFHIGGTYTDIAATGKLSLVQGEFQFSGRHFQLLEGSLVFNGQAHEMPSLNLVSEIIVKDIAITASLKGPLNNPHLSLQSTPPLPLSTIMSYLLFGQELAEINSFQAWQLANSLSSLAGQSPDVLENTRKMLGIDQLNLVSTSNGNEEVEDTIVLQVGKYISEGVLVSLTQGVEDASSNISIEIELNKGWSIQLESDQRQEQGKISVKWNQNY